MSGLRGVWVTYSKINIGLGPNAPRAGPGEILKFRPVQTCTLHLRPIGYQAVVTSFTVQYAIYVHRCVVAWQLFIASSDQYATPRRSIRNTAQT
jgi:hypothetical protein